jgi:tungstate transport system ATP-binding protein
MSTVPTVPHLPIVFEQVQIRSGGKNLLQEVSLTIGQGPPTVIIGPNGSGKTTLLRAAMGLVPASDGRITWGGRQRPALDRSAIVFQRPVMFRRSAAGNVRLALDAVGVPGRLRKERTAELLTLVGLAEMAERPARQLSGGEQQRLALARALARNPAVLFLDEPTASLDPAAAQAIEDILFTLSADGIKIVLTTHDLGEARRLAGEIVLLSRGLVIENTSAEQFFAAPRTADARRFLGGELLI